MSFASQLRIATYSDSNDTVLDIEVLATAEDLLTEFIAKDLMHD